MQSLPIDQHLPEICRVLREASALVLVAEPGAGKTTRVPPALVDAGVAGQGQVVVLEPRRLAARAAARRIAGERDGNVGGFAGFQVRFEKRVSRSTRVKVVTEGILTRLLQSDPSLSGVAIVVLDEFHERSLHADLDLALLAQVQRTLRPDLKILVMSATLDVEPVAEFLGGAPVLRVAGKAHRLAIEYLGRGGGQTLEECAADGVCRALSSGTGGVLAFLPGAREIHRTREVLGRRLVSQGLDLLALYGDMSSREQDRVLEPSPRRKVVLATNLAETSLTVPGVSSVVDSGLARVLVHDHGCGLDRLEIRRISKSSAAQRAGRAAREGAGRALRLWSAGEEARMRPHELPEIRRVDLTGAVLELLAWGERDMSAFRWFEAPDRPSIERAEALLIHLGALDRTSKSVTALGRVLVRIPAHPRVARMLHEAWRLNALEEGALLAALCSERDVLRTSSTAGTAPAGRLETGPSDLLARCDLLLGRANRSGFAVDPGARRTLEATRRHLEESARRAFGDAPASAHATEDDLLRIVFAGYPDRVARRRERGSSEAVMVGGAGAVLSPESAVRDEELFVVVNADLGRRREQARVWIRQASAVKRAWLDDVGGTALRTSTEARFDEVRECVVGVKRVLFHDLVLEERETGAPHPEDAERLLREAVLRDVRRAADPSPDGVRYLSRARALSAWMPELGLPSLDDGDIARALLPWCAGRKSLAELRAVPLREVIGSVLGERQRRAVDELVPDAVVLPSGRRLRLDYEPGQPPVLAARIQELFGLGKTPTVAAGRVAVVVQLLAPNMRVVQITQDLASFWSTVYPSVRKTLRARYPKHSWPEDPWTAPPVSRPRKRD